MSAQPTPPTRPKVTAAPTGSPTESTGSPTESTGEAIGDGTAIAASSADTEPVGIPAASSLRTSVCVMTITVNVGCHMKTSKRYPNGTSAPQRHLDTPTAPQRRLRTRTDTNANVCGHRTSSKGLVVVGGQRAAEACSVVGLVVPDGSGEGEEAGADAHGDAGAGAAFVAFEAELAFEGLVDRFNDLAQGPQEPGAGPWGLGSCGGAQQGDADVAEVGFERFGAVAVVGDEGLAVPGDPGRAIRAGRSVPGDPCRAIRAGRPRPGDPCRAIPAGRSVPGDPGRGDHVDADFAFVGFRAGECERDRQSRRRGDKVQPQTPEVP